MLLALTREFVGLLHENRVNAFLFFILVYLYIHAYIDIKKQLVGKKEQMIPHYIDSKLCLQGHQARGVTLDYFLNWTTEVSVLMVLTKTLERFFC